MSKPDPSRCYWIILRDPNGREVIKKLFRVFPGEDAAAEYLGKQIGFELGRDAMADMKQPA